MQVFKFTSIDICPSGAPSYSLQNIDNKVIYLSRFDTLNDPHELLVRSYFSEPRDDADLKMKRRALAEYIRRIRREYQRDEKVKVFEGKRLQEIRLMNRRQLQLYTDLIGNRIQSNSNALFVGEVRMSCFSRSCEHPLLWAHYAERMKGICLEYDLPNENNERFMSVEYVDEPPSIDLWRFIMGERLIFLDFYKYKSKHWEYEEEERLVWDTEKLRHEEKSLKNIIIGYRCPAECAENILETLKNYDTPPGLKIATPKRDMYGVNISGTIEPGDIIRELAKYKTVKPGGIFIKSTAMQ